MTEEQIVAQFSANLKYLRTRQRYTQTEFSKTLRVRTSNLQHWEKGVAIPNCDMVTAIARYFTVTVDDLLLTNLRKEVNDP